MLSPDGFRAVAGVTATEPPAHRPPAHTASQGPRWQLPACLTDHWASVSLEDVAEQLALPRAKEASLSLLPDRPWAALALARASSCGATPAWGPLHTGGGCGPGGLRREAPGNQKGLTGGRKWEVVAPTSPGHMEERPAGPPAGVSSSGQAGHGQALSHGAPLTWRQAWPGHPGQRQESRTQAQVRPPQSEGSGRHPPLSAWRFPHRVRRRGPQSLRSPRSPRGGHGMDHTAPTEEGPTHHHVYGTPGRAAAAPPRPRKTGQQRSPQETGRWPRCDQGCTWAPTPPFPGGFTRLGASRVSPTRRSGQGAGTPPGLQGPGQGTPPPCTSDVHKRRALHAQLHPPPLAWGPAVTNGVKALNPAAPGPCAGLTGGGGGCYLDGDAAAGA